MTGMHWVELTWPAELHEADAIQLLLVLLWAITGSRDLRSAKVAVG